MEKKEEKNNNNNLNEDESNLELANDFAIRNISCFNDNYIDISSNKKVFIKDDSYTDLLNNTQINDMRRTLQLSKSSNEIIIDKKRKKTKSEQIFLEKKNILDEQIKNHETFCESFFLASFPIENGKILRNTEKDLADCKHDTCSYEIPAMQPEIIYKYPEDDKNIFEVNNLAASICFPNGIKLCYEENENEIKAFKNYRTYFISQNGDKYFAVIYHFFLKMLNCGFSEIYKMFPIRYQLSTYQDELCAVFNDELEEDISRKLEIYSELIFREYVNIPFCLCLISKYPFFEQMEKCLESIMITMNNFDTSPKELNQLITYIVKSIPLPPIKSKLSFALPYLNKICEIQNPYFEDILLFGFNPLIIFKHLTISNIICFFKLIIFEQKILVIGKDNDNISQIILNFVSLLYPFDWINTSIPIMSEKLLKFLEAFLPFLNGMNINLYEKAKKILEKTAKGVFIVDIDKNTININDNLKKNSKNIKINNYVSQNF